MSKNLLIKLKYFLFLVSLSFLNIVSAETSTSTSQTDYLAAANSSISDTGKLIKNVTSSIGGNLVILLSSVAFILFLYGLVRFIYDRSNGDETRLEKDKEAMGWGLAALFVLVSVWGIIKMFQGFLGIENSGDINLPKLCVNGSCDKSGGTVSSDSPIKIGGDFASSTNKLNINTVDGKYNVESIRMWNLPLKEGSSGNSNEVAQLQQFLKEHNYEIGSYGVDGKFGSNTSAAVKAFQKDNALNPDGIVGVGTKAVILYVYLNAQIDRDNYYVNTWPNIMTSGQSTDANTVDSVSRLQTFLVDQGYNIGNTGVQGIDGIYGGLTSKAVVQFQAKYYLKEDNLVGPSTKAVIKYIVNRNN